MPRLFTTTCPPDLVVVHTSPPVDGKVSLGIEVNILPAAIEAVRARGGIVVAQVNAQMPYTFGDAEISVDLVDFAVEVDADAALARRDGHRRRLRRPSATGSRPGWPTARPCSWASARCPTPCCPGSPAAAALRVWREMFSDGVLELDRAGALDTDAPLVSSFLFGSPELYAWVDRNPRVPMLRTETTNEPSLIARQPLMTSVNTALQVDLYAQANASRVKGQIFSGFGGQTDFIVGALHSPGGQAILALRSWHPKADVSTIVPMIEEPVTSFQASAIVTENGQAWIWGYDQKSQARHLIRDAAHPDVRDELWEEARALGFTAR